MRDVGWRRRIEREREVREILREKDEDASLSKHGVGILRKT